MPSTARSGGYHQKVPATIQITPNHGSLEILVWFDTAYLQANYMNAVIPSEPLKMV